MQRAPRSEASHQIAGETQWIGDMLDGVQGAGEIVFFGVQGGVLGDGLVPDVSRGRGRATMRVETDIIGLRQLARQAAFAAADVENFVPWANQFGDAFEFPRGMRGAFNAR